jgi:hypothetical protein
MRVRMLIKKELFLGMTQELWNTLKRECNEASNE